LLRLKRETKATNLLVAYPSAAVVPLLDKPSLAVLPFTNMSSDPDQEYFSDGIAE
jgi:adenylate cyclase